MTTISVALTTYNGTAFLSEQLESFARQSLLPTELVITDDCSTDNTVEVVEEFARRAPFQVRLERNPQNLGFNGNFARVLSLVSGDIVLISDQDDIWYEDKIERLVDTLNKHPDKLAVVHDEHILDQASGRRFTNSYAENLRRLGYSERELLSGNCTAMRKPLLDILLPFPDDINYDYWIGWLGDILDARLILYVPLQLYRRHGNNVSEPVLAEEAPNHWSVFLRSGMRDPRPDWASNNRQLALVASRITERRDAIDSLLGPGRAQAGLDRIKRESDLYNERAQLVGLPKWKRWPEVIKRLSNGWYGNFTGYKSAVKDLVRP